MPREIVTIQAGQCGNQIGLSFWDVLLSEHARLSKKPIFDDALSSFFKNTDGFGRDISSKKNSAIQNLKARCVVVDTEEGVINQLMKSDLRDIFDVSQTVKDVSGASNNWAHGFTFYGPKYQDSILDSIHRELEACDSPQSFLLFHSVGGGTGSGLGTYILSQLADNFPKIFRFTASVFPSKEDVVVTSPYNCTFATNQLINHADCVFPIDNDSLLTLCHPKKGLKKEESEESEKAERKQVFAKMNSIVGHLLSNLTCSMRYEGKLNIDLNEITMNMVPFPRLHFLMASMSPLQLLLNKVEPRSLDQMFQEILLPENQLVTSRPSAYKYLSIGLLLRGELSFSDVSRNIEKIKNNIDMVWWNKDGFKYGICDAKPSYHVASPAVLGPLPRQQHRNH